MDYTQYGKPVEGLWKKLSDLRTKRERCGWL